MIKKSLFQFKIVKHGNATIPIRFLVFSITIYNIHSFPLGKMVVKIIDSEMKWNLVIENWLALIF